MRPVYVLGVGAHPWGKFPDKPQLQLAIEALTAAVDDAGVRVRDLQGLVAASSRFEGGMGWGLHANEVLQAVAENGAPAVNVGGGCAAGGIAVHTAASMVASGECEVIAALGATNPAYWVCELVWQLRGQASGRQVPGARVGMSAVLGLGANGASVVLKK